MNINVFHLIKYTVNPEIGAVKGLCGFKTRYVAYRLHNNPVAETIFVDELLDKANQWFIDNNLELVMDYGLSNYVVTAFREVPDDVPEKWYNGIFRHDDKDLIRIETANFVIESMERDNLKMEGVLIEWVPKTNPDADVDIQDDNTDIYYVNPNDL